MAYLLDRINEQLGKTGYLPRTREARDWLLAKTQTLNPNRQELLRDQDRLVNRSMIGRMYFYFYDPKTKDMLPYYDRFPLVIPIELYPDGFLGLNLHYIHPKQRIILLDKLASFANNKQFDETTKLRLTYQTIKSASRIFEAKPCIKRYFWKNVKSRFVEITADEWDIAALVPYEYFVGTNKHNVWTESRKKF